METSPGVADITFSSDGRHIAWTTNDGTVRQWDCTTSSLSPPPFTLPSARLIRFSHPQPAFLTLSDPTAGIVRILSTSTGHVNHVLSSGRTDPDASVIAITPSSASATTEATTEAAPIPAGAFAILSNTRVSILSNNGTLLSYFESRGNISAASFPPSDFSTPQRLATGDSSGTCRLWSISSTTASCLLVLKSHTSRITSLAFSFDEGRRLASASFDGRTTVYDATARKPKTLHSIPPASKPAPKLHALAFSPSESSHQILATAGGDSAVRVQNPAAPPALAVFTHAAVVHALTFAPDGTRVASGAVDGFVRLSTVPSPRAVIPPPLDPDAETGSTLPVSDALPETVSPSRRGAHLLIFCPREPHALKCDICARQYNTTTRAPFVADCGHTYACRACSATLFEHSDSEVWCPVCGVVLSPRGVGPNFEFLRTLGLKASGEKGGQRLVGGVDACGEDARGDEGTVRDDDYIALDRLRWVEVHESHLSSSAYNVTHSGFLDFEACSVKLSRRFPANNFEVRRDAARRISNNIVRLSRLRGPHVLQFYGASRLRDPDGRILIISEQLPGGCLQDNLDHFRATDCSLSTDAVLNIAGQLVRTILLLHRSGIARASLEPRSVMLSLRLIDWNYTGRIKLADFGGSVSRAGAASDESLALMTSGAVPYLAPEALDPDAPKDHSDDHAFERAKRMDMYALAICLFELSSGVVAWKGLRAAQVVAAVVGRNDRPGFVPGHLQPELRTLMGNLWSQDPSLRPSAEEAVLILDGIPSAPPLL